MSATQDDENWFVLRKGKRSGPHTLAALVRAVEKGIVGPEAGIWCVGWAEWRIARDVPELFGRESEPDLEKDTDAPEKVPDQDPVDTPDHIGELITKLDEAPPREPEHPKTDHGGGVRRRLMISGLSVLAVEPEHPKTDHGGGVRRRVMISGLSVLAVLVIVFGLVWAATSMGIIRVEFMPPK
jgi:GYF domain 2